MHREGGLDWTAGYTEGKGHLQGSKVCLEALWLGFPSHNHCPHWAPGFVLAQELGDCKNNRQLTAAGDDVSVI